MVVLVSDISKVLVGGLVFVLTDREGLFVQRYI